VGSSLEGVIGGAGGCGCPSPGGGEVRQDNTRLWRFGAQGGNKLGSSLQWRAAEHGVLAREGTDDFYIRASGGGVFLARQGGEVATWAQGSAASTTNGGLRAARPANGRRRRGRTAHTGVARGTGQRAHQHHAQETRGDAWTTGHCRASACGPSRAAARRRATPVRARALEHQGAIPNSA
jgi:hypothetical protein